MYTIKDLEGYEFESINDAADLLKDKITCFDLYSFPVILRDGEVVAKFEVLPSFRFESTITDNEDALYIISFGRDNYRYANSAVDVYREILNSRILHTHGQRIQVSRCCLPSNAQYFVADVYLTATLVLQALPKSPKS